MTPLPKRRWSTRRQGKKRATLNVSFSKTEICTNCGSPLKLPHRVCLSCGFYKGIEIIKIKPIKERKPQN